MYSLVGGEWGRKAGPALLRRLAHRRLTWIPHCSILWNAASNDAVTDGKITVSPILVVVRENDVGHPCLQSDERSNPAASLATQPRDYCCSFLMCPLFPPLNPVILWRQPRRRAHARVRCQDVKGCVNPLPVDAISHTTAGRWRGQRAMMENVNPGSRHVHENLADCTKWKSSLSARTQIGAYTPGMPFGSTKK